MSVSLSYVEKLADGSVEKNIDMIDNPHRLLAIRS